MMLSQILVAGLSAAALLAAGSVGHAATPDARFDYRVGPPPSNPHDVFRPVIKPPKAGGSAQAGQDCPCPMMSLCSEQAPKG